MTFLDKIRIKVSILINRLSKPVMLEKSNLKKNLNIKGTRISSTTFIDYPENLELGENVYVGQFNFIEASNHIKIGKGTQITNYVSITSHSSHDSIRLYGEQYKSTVNHLGYQKGKIIVGDYCYIGPYSLLSPGTKIGNGCIVKSHSVLKGDFPDFSIISGNPAHVIGNTRERDAKFLAEFAELESTYYLNEKE
jgi:acetyltransferase-like isoleucine patch superfamily enzyme